MDAPGTAEQATAIALPAATPDATDGEGDGVGTSMASPATAKGASGTPVPSISGTGESGGGAAAAGKEEAEQAAITTTGAEEKTEQAAANTTGAEEKTEQAEDPSSSAAAAACIPVSSWAEQRAAMMARARARVADQEIRGHHSPDPIERGQPFFYKENEASPGAWRRTKGTVRQSQQNKPLNVKVLLLGASGTGAKTCAMRAFAANDYSANVITTIGIDYKIKMVELESGLQANVQVWDTAGQERFHTITKAYCRGADVCYLGYDVCDRNTYNDIEKRFLPMVRDHCAEGTPIVIVGNKCDLKAEDREVTVEEGEALARRAAWRYGQGKGGEGVEFEVVLSASASASLFRADHFDDQCVVPGEAVAMVEGDMMKGASVVQGGGGGGGDAAGGGN
jgi:small GTP-binding protein